MATCYVSFFFKSIDFWLTFQGDFNILRQFTKYSCAPDLEKIECQMKKW